MSEDAAAQAPAPVADRPDPASVDRILHQLYAQPWCVPVLAEACRIEERGHQYWKWSDVRQLPRMVDRLVLLSLVDKDGKWYKLTDYPATRDALWKYVEAQRVAQAARESPTAVPAPPPGAPTDLFAEIIGFSDVKRQLLLALNAKIPVSVLLVGPPASAKTLFLNAIANLPGAVYRYGEGITKAGLREMVLHDKVPYLIIDEIEKMDPEEDPILLAVLEQKVSVLHYGESALETIDTRVFGAANSTAKMRRELVSRFHVVRFPEYAPAEFRQIAYLYLTRRDFDPEISRVIADGLSTKTKDIRDALRLAAMSPTLADAELNVAQLGQEARV